jgi:hypothetical protein
MNAASCGTTGELPRLALTPSALLLPLAATLSLIFPNRLSVVAGCLKSES